MREGSAVEVEYDIPADAWYFAANGARTMPFAVLLEAALQPCGWLATWAGSPLTTERDLSFRNLDGDGRLLAEVLPGDGTLRTRAVLTRDLAFGRDADRELRRLLQRRRAPGLRTQDGLRLLPRGGAGPAGRHPGGRRGTRSARRRRAPRRSIRTPAAAARDGGGPRLAAAPAADARPRDRRLARGRPGRARTLSRRDRRRPRGLVLQGALLPGPGAARLARRWKRCSSCCSSRCSTGVWPAGRAEPRASSRSRSASRTPGSTAGRCCRATAG